MKVTAQLFKALSEEIRLRIINLLSSGELCVCDLVELLDLPQSTVSRHLAYLRNCGLISDRREGVWMYYQLQKDLDDFQQLLLELLQQQLAALPQCLRDRAVLERRTTQKTKTC